MAFELQLSMSVNEVPKFWLNFLIDRSGEMDNKIVSLDTFVIVINEQLKCFNCIYISTEDKEPTLLFSTEKDATLFILRWS